MQFSVAFLEEDVYFLEQFLSYTIRHPQDYICFHFFKSIEEFAEYRKNNQYDAVLCAVCLADDYQQLGYTDRCILLCEEDLPCALAGFDRVEKYQPVTSFCSSLLELLGNKAEKQQLRGVKKTEITTCFALYPFPGQCAYAFLLARIMAETKKVLYLNFMQLAETAGAGGTGVSRNLSDVLFCFGQERERAMQKLAVSVQHHENLDCLLPLSDPRHQSELPAHLCANLILDIRDTGRYDAIVIGIDHLFPGAIEMMLLSEKIYCTYRDSSCQRARRSEFLQLIRKGEGESLEDRILYLPVPPSLEETLESQSLEECRLGETGDILRSLLQGGC